MMMSLSPTFPQGDFKSKRLSGSGRRPAEPGDQPVTPRPGVGVDSAQPALEADRISVASAGRREPAMAGELAMRESVTPADRADRARVARS